MIDNINDVKIVEYDDKYADALAEMWNKSGDCWGGYDLSLSAETIRQEEAQSDHLFTWIALLNDKAIGFCTLSEYREDEGALYIDVLNVVPEFHGKKIGKKLVLTAVEKTVELGFPRVDLYTWSGNTKAVPLYKKCGFFWVNRDDSTHCMNLIPSVLNNDLLKQYIDEFDWYKDSVRPIKVEQDGIKHNGFEHYAYHWKKEETELEVDICRHSRGIKRIRTQDFEISAEINKLKQVFGKYYEVRYRIKNFTDSPLDLRIKGQDNKNISFTYDIEERVPNEKTFIASFYIDEIKEKQGKFRTYPAVCAEVTVNGKTSLIKVGVDPQFPLSLGCLGERDLYTCNTQEKLYLNVKNNFDEEVAYSITRPETDILEWDNPKIDFSLNAQEQDSIPLLCTFKKAGILHEKVRITAHFKNGTSFTYKDVLDHIFQTVSGIIYGETERKYYIINGTYQVLIDKSKFYNEMLFRNVLGMEHNWVFVLTPKIGKPYTSELYKKKPYHVEYNTHNNAVQIDMYYTIEQPAHLDLIIHMKLFQNGILERWFTVKNSTSAKTDIDIHLNNMICMELYKLVIPYRDAFVYVDYDTPNFNERYDGSKINENWLFSYGMNDTVGITWDDPFKVIFSEDVFFEYSLGRLEAGEEKTTGKIRAMIGTFKQWHEFREFAHGKKLKKEKLTDHLQCVMNDGNPFIDSGFTVEIKEYQEKSSEFSVRFSSDENCFEPLTIMHDPKKQSQQVTIEPKAQCECIHFHAQVQEFTPSRTLHKALFPKSEDPVFCKNVKDKGHDTWMCHNGIITINAAADYAPALYSLSAHDQEWIDSDFPVPAPKSWWNPWIGGIFAHPNGMQMRSLLKEKYHVDFVTLRDDALNEWKGIKISISIHEFEMYKGLTWNQYFLLLPGIPVLCYVPEIIQNTGKYYKMFHLISRYFARVDEDIKNTFMRSYNSQHESYEYYSGRECVDIYSEDVRAIGSPSREYMIQVWNDQYVHNDISFNNDITCFWMNDYASIKNTEKRFLAPKFLILTKELLSQNEVRDLRNITFSHQKIERESL